ncbi:uncharacterized protein C18orf63-like isoform X1 [Schistocerca gregaria]|uniref:uncharacterized protein C18orf63-like isoform X1 n=1 Tax=Schistocerca gregaria TaxID=7010 RepID=UPI00211DCC04|nr:uncharacterized protein C18orf63-like isoform X1 [Schistocerca gregaria]
MPVKSLSMKPEEENGSRVVVFASVPKPSDLCCIVAKVNVSEKRDSSAKSDYQWQILKCRQLIFSVPEIIASPVLGSQGWIYVITTKGNKAAGRLDIHLQKFGLIEQGPIHLSNSIYEACLRYTLVAHIAPLWNQVDTYLVQGRDFLLSTCPLNAVKLEVAVKDEEVLLVIWPLRMKLPHLKLEEMEIIPSICQDFFSHKISVISEMSIIPQWVHVLPSMKKGKVVSVSHHLPESSPFKTYKELRRHWKNLYGYRLPESDENLIYYNVFFLPLAPNQYSYPNICICHMNAMVLKQVNFEAVLKEFLRDVNKKMPSVCGQSFILSCRLGYAIPKPMALNQNLVLPNLSSSSRVQHKDLQPISPAFLKMTPVCSLEPECTKMNSSESKGKIQLPQAKGSPSGSRCVSLMSSSEHAPTPAGVCPVLQCDLSNPTVADSAPDFQIQAAVNEKCAEIGKTNQIKYVPIFKKRVCVPYRRTLEGQHESAKNDINNSSSKYAEKCDQLTGQSTTEKHSTSLSQLLMQTHESSSPATLQVPVPSGQLQVKFIAHTLQNPLLNSVPSLKRSVQTSSPSSAVPTSKKPRPRPQVQNDVDVEILARNNDLVKVNTVTLVSWLRQKNVPCKVKDKKGDLVEKVMNYLNSQKNDSH